jgi:uncharacterized protein YhjY with autotransporter beta-barrel domain
MRPFLSAAVLFFLAAMPPAASAAPLKVRVLDAAGPEGNSGTRTLTFTYSIPFAINNPVTGDYRTVDGTATAADNDYVPTQGSFTIPPGQTESTPVSVTIVGDVKVETDESFTVIAENVQNAQTPPPTTFTLLNDDAPVLTVSSPRVAEGNAGTTPLVFTVTIAPAAGTPVQVQYGTAPGTATAGVDFAPTAGTVTFAPGQATQTVTVSVIGDTAFEGDETLSLLVTPAGGQVPAIGIGTIVNDDSRTASAVTIISGGNQSGRLGQALPEPLVVRVVDDTGAPVSGVVVRWAVTRGNATLNPTSSTTGADGRASTTVTLNSVGTIEVTATAGTLPPVTFTFSSAISLEGRARGPVAIPIARVIDRICARNEERFEQVCQTLSRLSDDQLTPALEQVAPQQSGAQAKVAGEVIGAVTSGIGARLSALRSGERFSVQRVTINRDGRSIPIGQIAQALFSHSGSHEILSDAGPGLVFAQVDQGTSAAGGDEDDYNGWSAYLSGNLGTGERIARSGQLGFDLKTRGLMFGVDRQFGDNVFGASLNLMQLDSDLTGNAGSVDTSGYALSIYGSRGGLLAGNGPPAAGAGTHYDGLHVEGSLTLGRNTYESEHNVQIGPLSIERATSENDGTVFGVSGVTGVEAHRGRTDFDFSVSGTWSKARIDDLTESGNGPLILFVEGHDVESLTGTGAFNLRSAFAVPFGTLIPSFRAEFVHEFRAGARLVTARFLRDQLNTSFTIPLDTPDSNYGRLGAGLQASFPYGWSAFVEVSQDVARSDLHFRTLQFNLMKSF